MRFSLATSLLIFLFFSSLSVFQANAQPRLPNIILIIADDLGYSDLSSFGNKFLHTPNIDGLGVNGVRFTRAYVTAPICAPSRVGIMTGCYQNRFGSEFMPYPKFDPAFMKQLRKSYMPFHAKTEGEKTMKPHFGIDRSKYHTGLPTDEITIAELVRKAGYATGLVGKWNLGEEDTKFPEQCGYDYSYFFTGALTRYVDDPVDTFRYVNQRLPWAFSDMAAWQPRAASTAIREGKNIVKDTGYLTFSIAKKGIEFIDRNKDRPFFLTLTFNAPHDPFQVPRSYFDRITTTNDRVKRVYYGMIEALDDAVGEVLKKIESLGLEQNTMVMFISDNGGATYTRATDNAPLSGGKCTHLEGGLLVPFFIKYPSMISTPSVYEKSVSSLDIFSTIAALAKADLPTDRSFDGVNLFPFLSNSTSAPHELLFWRSGYSKAVCKGDWKLYVNEKDGRNYLFNLNDDIAEKRDLSKTRPDKLNELMKVLEQWEKTQTVKPAWPSASDVSIDVDGVIFHFPA